MRLLLISLLIFNVFLGALSQNVSSYSIVGTVLTDDSIPRAFSLVMLYKENDGLISIPTDFDGKYTLVPIPEGVYNICVARAGYRKVFQKVVLTSNQQTVTIDFNLKRLNKGEYEDYSDVPEEYINAQNYFNIDSFDDINVLHDAIDLKRAPVAVESINSQSDSTWVISVEVLKQNPDWLPGSSTEFFLKTGSVLYNLVISKNVTKTFKCNGSSNAETLVNTDEFINNLVRKKDAAYTAYFDINGINVTAIYEQCLP